MRRVRSHADHTEELTIVVGSRQYCEPSHRVNALTSAQQRTQPENRERRFISDRVFPNFGGT